MMTPSTSENHGLKRSVLLVACLFMLTAHACGKSETEQASKTVEQAGDATGKAVGKTKKMANEVVKTAGDIADKASESAKDAYDAAGKAVEKTVDKAGDTYKSTGELKNRMQEKSEEVTHAAEKQVGKALENVPSLPGK